MSDHIRVERAGAVGTIWLDRPAKRNAMDHAMWVALQRACEALSADRTVRVVVVRGAGGHFCAGADIGELQREQPPGTPSFNEVNVAAEHALARLPKPTVAFVEGDCIGGGCAIAIDCDLRLATETARFGITPAKLGIVYPEASLARVVHLLGPATAKRLLFTGDLIDAHEALRVGLVDELRAPHEAPARLDELTAVLASRSLLSQAASKEMVAAILATGEVPGEVAARWRAEAAAAPDLAEGVAAFGERRQPHFRWSGPASTGEAGR